MATPAIDVLVPVYNSAATVKESLASIRAQTVKDIRIVVVNDGSTDGSADIVASLAQSDQRICLINRPNSGIVDTLNFGLGTCQAEFIARFDADDISYPNRFEVQLAYLRNHPDCLAVGGRVDHIDEEGRPLYGLPHPGPPELADPAWVPAGEPYLIHPFLMARRAALAKVGGYRFVPNSEDTDLYWRLAEHGRLHNLDTALGQYRMHTKSISGSSIGNGRIMAACSQLAALSAIRRRQGRPDLDFTADHARQLRTSGSLEDVYHRACTGLDDDESRHLSAAISAKLLELTNYRPYELEVADCAFIRKSLERTETLPWQNQKELKWLATVAAARLITKGKLREAAALVAPSSYPVVAARVLRRLAGR